jgi:hypothetical protein
METTLSRTFEPTSGEPDPGPQGGGGSRFEIAVVYTRESATLAALRHAARLAKGSGRPVALVVPLLVPFPQPLDQPLESREWIHRRFAALASLSPVETQVHIYLCRDRAQAVADYVPPRAVTLIGRRARWWPFTAEATLARRLTRAGREVVCVESE